MKLWGEQIWLLTPWSSQPSGEDRPSVKWWQNKCWLTDGMSTTKKQHMWWWEVLRGELWAAQGGQGVLPWENEALAESWIMSGKGQVQTAEISIPGRVSGVCKGLWEGNLEVTRYQGLKEDTRGWFPPLGITVSLCSSAPNCTLDPNNHYWPRTSHMPPHSCRNSEHVAFSQRFITLVLYLNQWLSLLSLWGVLMTLIPPSTLGVV